MEKSESEKYFDLPPSYTLSSDTGSTDTFIPGKEPFSDCCAADDSASYNKSWGQNIIDYIIAIRMEPGFLIYMVASVMGNLISSDLQIDRACRINMGYNDSVCDSLMANRKNQMYDWEERQIQKVISEIGTWSEVIENFFPILYSLFLGAWSDVYGVKLPFLVSIFGVVLRYAGLIICVYYTHWSAQIITLFSVIPGSFTGGRIAISMVVYSFVAITTTLKERTIRVGILTAIRTFGRSAGSALGGYMKRNGKTHYFIFGIGGGLAITSFLYILVIMPNPKKGSNPSGFDKNSKMAAVKNLFNWRNVLDSAKAFLRFRAYGIRTQLILLVIVLIFTMAPMQGEDSVLNLFVRNQLGWSTADYAEYSTFRMLIAFGGGLISVGLLVHWIKLADWKLGVVSCISQIAGSMIYAYSTTKLMMYIAPVVDILNGTMIIAARAMLSKISPIEEMGKINAFIAVIDSTTPLWGNPVYNAVYRETLEKFAGAFFVLSAALTIPPLLLFSYMGVTKKGIPTHEQAERHNKLHGPPELIGI